MIIAMITVAQVNYIILPTIPTTTYNIILIVYTMLYILFTTMSSNQAMNRPGIFTVIIQAVKILRALL